MAVTWGDRSPVLSRLWVGSSTGHRQLQPARAGTGHTTLSVATQTRAHRTLHTHTADSPRLQLSGSSLVTITTPVSPWPPHWTHGRSSQFHPPLQPGKGAPGRARARPAARGETRVRGDSRPAPASLSGKCQPHKVAAKSAKGGCKPILMPLTIFQMYFIGTYLQILL